jgi:hypothetical protein
LPGLVLAFTKFDCFGVILCRAHSVLVSAYD